MTAGTLLRLGTAGSRTDRLRTVVTALSSALAAVALMAAATVASIRGGDVPKGGDGARTPGSGHYSNALLTEAGLRVGVVIALVLLSLPVLALAGQCVRLGAPARDRRLAAIRLAGATPRQAVLIGGAETAVASLLGSIAGFGLFLLLRVLAERRTPSGKLVLPTDLMPSPPVTALMLLTVPVLSAVFGALLLRKVAIGPLGVLRSRARRSPRPWPGLLIAGGLAGATVTAPLRPTTLPPDVKLIVLGLCAVAVMVGVVVGTGWISWTAGWVLHRLGRRPAVLLAGRRLMADPWNGSRTLAALLVTVIAGGIVLGYRELTVTEFAADHALNKLLGDTVTGAAEDDAFYLGALRLVMIAVTIGLCVATAGVLVTMAESIVARRRSYAALTATGVPRTVLSESVLWHTFAPLLPAVAIALTAGIGLARTLGTTVERSFESTVCRGTGAECAGPTAVWETVPGPEVVLSVPVPWTGLLTLGAVAVAAMLTAVGAGLLVLRSSTDLTELRSYS